MNQEFVITDTRVAAEAGQTLMAENFYESLVTDLTNIKSEITNNWEGDSADILSITSQIDSLVTEITGKITPSQVYLGTGVYNLAWEASQIASSDVNTGSVTPESTQPAAPAATAATGSEKPGFWEYHGNNFANDWDYSGCDGALDYVGATLDGVIGSVGSTVNFVGDAIGEFFDWIF